jgi:hypothetical protein
MTNRSLREELIFNHLPQVKPLARLSTDSIRLAT